MSERTTPRKSVRKDGFTVAAVVGALAAAACGGDPVTLPLAVDLRVDVASCGGTAGEIVLDYGCGVQVALHVVNIDDEAVLASDCVTLERSVGSTLAALPSLLEEAGPHLAPVPEGRRVRLEVALYSPPTFGPDCPRFVIAPDGTTSLPVSPNDPMSFPVFYGTSAPVRLDGTPRFEVPLFCGAAPFDCATQPPVSQITAEVRDLVSLAPPTEDLARELNVRAGYVVEAAPGGRYAWSSAGDLAYEGNGVWQSSAVDFFFPQGCVGSLVTKVGASPSLTASCDGKQDPGGTAALAYGYHLDAATRDRVLAALGLDDVPEGGLVVGRVVGPDGRGLAGATVSGAGMLVDMQPRVRYLNDDLSGLRNGDTGANGWFVVDDAAVPCCDALVARAEVGGQTIFGTSAGSVGLVGGIVMAVVIAVP